MRPWQRIPFALALTALQAQAPSAPAVAPPAPLYRLTVVSAPGQAVNYRTLTSTAKIGLKGTVLAQAATGQAKVWNDKGTIHIVAKVRNLPPASTFGQGYLTYVMWGISPEGRANNLGELVIKHGKCKLKTTEAIQTFGLVVTAEPYFAVGQPSDAVVMENHLDAKAQGKVEVVEATYALLKRGSYLLDGEAAQVLDPGTPLDVYQARGALRIARAAGAQSLAGEAFGKAEGLLAKAEDTSGREAERVLAAREAVNRAEDARMLSVQRQETQRLAMEQRSAQDKIDQAKMQAALAADAEAQARRQTELARTEAQDLRGKLLAQFSSILETRATARGLIVNMSGVLFRTGKADLAPAAKEKLAKIAGILASHKGLKIEADGYTDSTGSEAFNQELSEKRAMITRDFLVGQGVPSDSIISRGLGEASPVAPNDTDQGRRENRRVELVVTGEGLARPD